MDQHLYQHFLSLLDVKHLQELKVTDKVLNEYHELENVPPAPGQPNKQHDAMVQGGLCKGATKNEHKNRYCNLFPFDRNLVHLEEKEYVNASWIKLPKDSGDNSSREYLSIPSDKDKNREYIVTMGPLHPSSFEKTLSSN